MDDTEKLKGFREKIDEAKQRLARLEGQIQSESDTLKEKFGVGDLDEAKKRHGELIKEAEKIEDQMARIMKAIEKQYSLDR